MKSLSKERLAILRGKLRREQDYVKADIIRDVLLEEGYEVKDLRNESFADEIRDEEHYYKWLFKKEREEHRSTKEKLARASNLFSVLKQYVQGGRISIKEQKLLRDIKNSPKAPKGNSFY